jgi:DNA-binding FadR family transcriptional regulator
MTVFGPVAAPSTLDETVSRLGTAIRVGVLAPGSRLPPERELAEQLGISRSTLRQALALLTETGHLTAVRGRSGGTFVAEDPPIGTNSAQPPDDWRAFLDWRVALELGAVQLAAERACGGGAGLREAFAALEQAVDGEWPSFRRADASFHIALAELACSPRLLSEMTRLQGHLSDLLLAVAPDRRREANAEHRLVLEAVLDGDGPAATAAMREHLGATERLVAAKFN